MIIKYIFICSLATFLATSCKKPAEEITAVGTTAQEKDTTRPRLVLDVWQLASYYTFTGGDNYIIQEADPNLPERVSFTSNGSFSSNQNWPWFSMGFDHYEMAQKETVHLSNTTTNVSLVFRYKILYDGSLLFHPLGRDIGFRRYIMAG